MDYLLDIIPVFATGDYKLILAFNNGSNGNTLFEVEYSVFANAGSYRIFK
jgi:hypothetical protein